MPLKELDGFEDRPMNTIFDYLDYRQFLGDFYECKKKESPHFSHRFIAKKLGFDSGYFTKIIQKKRHISQRLSQKFVDFLKLGNRESEYFQTLVLFAKSKTQTEKNWHYEKLLTFKRSHASVLSKKQYEIFNSWHNLAIREMIACFKFTGDYVDLGRRLQPPISAAKAKKAVALLQRLGLVRRNQNGVFERLEPVWTTDREVESVIVNKMQLQMLDRAKEAYDNSLSEGRNMSTLTLSVSKGEYQRMVEDIAELRSRFLERARNTPAPDRVYQLSIALFPLSKIPKEERV
jgi:uncharacterized protein (TIGR02147 family)